MENSKAILKSKNIKCTNARIYILKLLMNSENSVSAYDIQKYFLDKNLNVDLSTIYRNLELFYENNIVNKFDMGDGKYNYSFRYDEHKHILKCKLCNKEVEIDCPMFPIKELVKDKTGFVLLEEDIKFNGICEKCIKKTKNNRS